MSTSASYVMFFFGLFTIFSSLVSTLAITAASFDRTLRSSASFQVSVDLSISSHPRSIPTMPWTTESLFDMSSPIAARGGVEPPPPLRPEGPRLRPPAFAATPTARVKAGTGCGCRRHQI